MLTASSPLLLFTQADVGGHALFRVVPVEVSVRPGQGRLWVDLSRGNAFTPAWQAHARHLGALGRAHYALPWEQTDLHVSARGRDVTLDGRSASLPLFVAWVALLSGRPLPSPFLGTGVALDDRGERLAPAPREFMQGKLGVAQAYVKQVFPQAGRVAVYVPEGSPFDAEALPSLDVRPVPTLTRAVAAVLGLQPRERAGNVVAKQEVGGMIRQGVRAIREMYGLTRGLGNLRVMLGSGLVGMLASGLLNPVMPLYLRSRGLDFQAIGLMYTVGSLLPIFVQPVLGALSDRYGRKPFVVGLSLVTSLMVPAVALVDDPKPLAAVMILKMLLSRSGAPVSNAMVADFAPTKQRATIFAMLDATSNLVFVAALFASSAVIRALSVSGAFFLAGGLFLVGSLILLALDDSQAAPRAEAKPGQVQAGWRLAFQGLLSPFTYVKAHPNLSGLFLWQFFFTFALALFPTYLPLYAVELGAPREMVGPLVAASWLVYAFTQPFGGRLSDRLPRRVGLIVMGQAGMATLAAVLGASGWMPQGWALMSLVVAWVLLAVPDGLHRSSASALVVEQVPSPQERGRFMGALGSSAALASVLAPITYGLVAQKAGLGFTFVVSSAAFVLALGCVSRVREASAALPLDVAPAAALTPTSEPG